MSFWEMTVAGKEKCRSGTRQCSANRKTRDKAAAGKEKIIAFGTKLWLVKRGKETLF